MFITTFFRKVAAGFSYLFTPAGQKKVLSAMCQAEALVEEVLPIVEIIAAGTPNKTDDEIVAVVKNGLCPSPSPPAL